MALINCPECKKEISAELKVCVHCGYSIKKTNKKVILISIGIILLLFSFLIFSHIICINHKYIDATCTKAKTCKYCGKTQGIPLEHEWVNATCVKAKYCKVCEISQGNPLGHKWINATCIKQKYCSVCEETEGEFAKHIWKNATCSTPKTCFVCNKTEGKADGKHNWNPATYTTPKTCEYCGSTEGNPLKEEIVKKYYKVATDMTVSDLVESKNGGTYAYIFKGDVIIPLLKDDNKWINNPRNKKGTVNQGAVYRKIAKLLIGFESGFTDYQDFSELLLGFVPDTREEFVVYQKNAKNFITEKDTLKNIMKKFSILESVEGEFDFNSGKLGHYVFIIEDLSECATEMGISEEMLGFIFGALDEYGPSIEFKNNGCSFSYDW